MARNDHKNFTRGGQNFNKNVTFSVNKNTPGQVMRWLENNHPFEAVTLRTYKTARVRRSLRRSKKSPSGTIHTIAAGSGPSIHAPHGLEISSLAGYVARTKNSYVGSLAHVITLSRTAEASKSWEWWKRIMYRTLVPYSAIASPCIVNDLCNRIGALQNNQRWNSRTSG